MSQLSEALTQSRWKPSLSQELLVFLCSAAVFLVFSLTLERFLAIGNLSNLLFNISILGILGCGMGVVVIGRGIDLSQIAIMAVTAAWLLQLLAYEFSPGSALVLVFALAILLGATNGIVVAYLEVPALFATLATGLLFFGAARVFLLSGNVLYLPSDQAGIISIAQGMLLGVPIPIVLFAIIVLLLAGILRFTVFGRSLYAQGDNGAAARISGAEIRPMIVIEYVISALTAVVGGLVFAGASAAIDLQVVRSTMIFDVVLVVVLGGISLSGGRGSMISVVAGTLLIGTLLNGMVIMDINSNLQSAIKGLVLIGAILFDRYLHPVDEEIAKQGDTL